MDEYYYLSEYIQDCYESYMRKYWDDLAVDEWLDAEIEEEYKEAEQGDTGENG